MRPLIAVFNSFLAIPVRFLCLTAVFGAAFCTPACPTDGGMPAPPEYRLRLYHTHTGERLDIVYKKDGKYIPEAVTELDHFLRDHRTGADASYDPRIFDLLRDVTVKVGRPRAEIQIICGYRTPWSNALLRSRSKDVAEHSLHMVPEAVDIRVEGVRTAKVRDAALALRRGGVGYYFKSDFVHVDLGRVRRW